MNISKLATPRAAGSVTCLATGTASTPRISGDGSTVAWNEQIGDNLEIVRYRDGVAEPITHNGTDDMHVQLSRDGQTLAWQRFNSEAGDPNGRWQVVVERDGEQQMVTDAASNSSEPVLSPDGQRVAWNNDVNGKGQDWRVQELASGVISDLTPEEGHSSAQGYTGDSQQLVWRTFWPGGSDVFSQMGRLTISPEDEITPAANQDASAIFFASTARGREDKDLYRVDVASQRVELISGEPGVDETWLHATPDGRTVVWSNYDKTGPDTDAQIVRWHDGKKSVLSEGDTLKGFPRVSDDGNKVVWMELDQTTGSTSVMQWSAG